MPQYPATRSGTLSRYALQSRDKGRSFFVIYYSRRYTCTIHTCGFPPLALFAGTPARSVPAFSRFPHFPQVRLHDSYLPFLASLIFRRYKPPNHTCVFSLPSFSAGTPTRFVRAISRFPHLPQVQAAQSYLRFLASIIFHRYKPPNHTCGFPLSSFSAGTLARSVPVISRFPPFSQVHLLDSYLRFPTSRAFRRYACTIRTCDFPLPSISAGTPTRFIPAPSLLPHFSQVRLHDSYLRFPASINFRRYTYTIRTCHFSLPSFSTGKSRPIIPAVSRFPHFSHVRLHDSYLRFPTSRAFRRYAYTIRTCHFPLSSFSASTPTRFIPAVSRFPHLPQVQAAQSYLLFLASLIFRRYKPPSHTCPFPASFLPPCKAFI